VPNALTHPIPLMTTPVRTGAYVTIAPHAEPQPCDTLGQQQP
jgi:hypothetical protein